MEGTPLSELEKRIVVAEALRLSQIPIEKLLDLLREEQITPLWDHMVLPPGRTMAMCKNAFEMLYRPNQIPTFQSIPHISGSQTSTKRKSGSEIYDQRSYEPAAKRRQSAVEPKLGGRELAPKPSNGSPGPTGSVLGKVPKKRGRPSKADVERSKQEAIAKGVIMAPTTSIPTMSPKIAPEEHGTYASIAPTPPMTTTGTFYDPTLRSTPDRDTPQPMPHLRDSPGKTKRKPPPKAKPPPGQTSFTILPPVYQSREEQPPASNSMANMQHGPVSGSTTERMPSSLHAFTIANEPHASTEPRSEV